MMDNSLSDYIVDDNLKETMRYIGKKRDEAVEELKRTVEGMNSIFFMGDNGVKCFHDDHAEKLLALIRSYNNSISEIYDVANRNGCVEMPENQFEQFSAASIGLSKWYIVHAKKYTCGSVVVEKSDIINNTPHRIFFHKSKLFHNGTLDLCRNGGISSASQLRLDGVDVQPAVKLPSVNDMGYIVGDALASGIKVESEDVKRAILGGYKRGGDSDDDSHIFDALITLLVGMGFGTKE